MSRALALVESDESRKKESPGSATLRQLLETKLYAPRVQAALVARPRLLDAMREGMDRKLTVVVAPAGFGKTTLLASWLADAAGPGPSVGWVSLDATENDPQLFWSYVIRALQGIYASVGAGAMKLLQAQQIGSSEPVLTALINDLNALDDDVTLVLDDYHVIEVDAIHTDVTFLLDHLPPRMRVVIASRADPPLALSRLRARGQLTELRAGDMRFTPDEAGAFLNDVMALGLSPQDTATLERRTEGWIAGLKLSAMSMKGRDVRRFVDAFSGDVRHIADYLVDEVLGVEAEPVRRFLLATSILDRLSGPLCDAVTGGTGGQALLEDLERRNLFVVALDDKRDWFRYHHLFADVLQKQALAKDPVATRTHHQRASVWYEAHGTRVDAVTHALAARDVERAAALLQTDWPGNDRSYESRRWLDRVKSLPLEVVRARPRLGMGYAWALLNSGELEAAEPRLRDVEEWLGGAGDDATARSLRKELASARVYLTQSLGGVPGSLEHARQALQLVAEDDAIGRATGTALVALALWGRGDLEAAHRTFSESLAMMRACGHELDEIRGIFVLGDIRVSQGRLREAASTYESGLRVASEGNFASPPETDELYLGLSEVHREWNDLMSATRYLDQLAQEAQRSAHKGNRLRWCTAMGAVHMAKGDASGAIMLLAEAEAAERRDPLPRLRPIPAMRARIALSQGNAEAAREWARSARLSADDDLSYLREFEHITFARVLASGSPGDAERLLERLAVAARTGGRIGSLIEILVLQSLAQQGKGATRGALDTLGEALALAEPERYLRVFLDEGTPMRDLLRHAVARGLAGEYARKVLAAFDAPQQVAAPMPVAAATNGGDTTQPLTTRELEILRLIAAGMRNQEIANHLDISTATVKRHIANTYGKLGAGHRTEALATAARLKLL